MKPQPSDPAAENGLDERQQWPRQVWLFDTPRPLRDKLPDDVFRCVPTGPGVYVMTGRLGAAQAERVLYVGKAANLRRRLSSYRNIRPGQVARRLARLACAVRHVTWETRADEADSLLRENELLRLHRPVFNRVNTHPESYWYLRIERKKLELVFRRVRHCPAWPTVLKGSSRERLFGAYKSGIGYGALVRLLWALSSGLDRGDSGGLFRGRIPAVFRMDLARLGEGSGSLADTFPELVMAFFDGASCRLVFSLAEALPGVRAASLFERRWWEKDLREVEQFFQSGPCRCRRLRDRFGLSPGVIPAQELDDWLVLDRQVAGELAPGQISAQSRVPTA